MTWRASQSTIAFPIATWFGCGYAPIAPGTAGSLAAVGIAMLGNHFWGWGRIHFLGLAALLLLPGIWAAHVVVRETGREDPGLIVVDEVVGQWITLAGATVYNWKVSVGAFFLFRLLDIWKPAPVRQLESLPGGLGIVADDVMAGVYGALVLLTAGCFNLY